MKKFTLFLVAMLFSAFSFAALNPYAYGLSSQLSADEATLTVNYSLNAPATAVSVVILDGETVVKTVDCAGIAKGSYTVDIPTAELPKTKSLTWKVEVKGNNVSSPTKETTTFKFWIPYSMDVDVDTESDYFGRWYVIEATNGGQGKAGYHSTSVGRGLYAFNAALEPIKNNSGTYGFTGGMTLGATEQNEAGDYINLSCVTTSGGRVFVGRFRSGYAPILEATDLHSTDYPIILSSAGGRAIALDARGSGENLQLVMLDTDYNIKEYDLGAAESWVTPATPSRTISTTGLTIERKDAAITYDNEGGIWVNQNSASNPTIAHLSTSGLDYDNISAGLSHVLGTAGYNIRGVAINQEGTELAVPGVGRGNVVVFSISKDSEGNISLTQKYKITTGNNNTALSYDYAGNLYIANRSAETITFYAMPYSGMVSTPCASKYAFELQEVAPTTYTVTVNINGNGTVIGDGTYEEGETITLTATPAEHYEFTGWTGDVTSTDNPLTITVDGDKNITANFTKKNYTLTVFVNDENKGTVDVATGSHEYGTEVTLTATPKPGYKLLAWSNKATTPSITLTMDNNKAVSAYFVKEYATDPTFTIEKVWENTHVAESTNNGYQGVGWNGTIYVQDAGNKKILTYSDADDTGTEYVTSSGVGQQIAVDEAGNLIVFNATFYVANPNAIIIYPNGSTTGTPVSFTLDAPGRCDFLTASGNIYSAEGGYVYFFCKDQKTISRLFIKNGAATAEDVTDDTIANITNAAASQSNVVLDIYGNIHTQSKNAGAFEYNITTLTSTADPYLAKKNSTIGGCTFELGGKEFWAYVAGTTAYSSEWQLINATDGKLVSEEILFAKDKTSTNSAANWLNVQVVDEKTAYIYQFCPTVAAAVWKVSFTENYTVSATATNGTVTGTGTYQEGATATLKATPNTGYKFVNWTKGGETITDNPYTFTVSDNVALVANFEAIASKDPRAWAYDMKLGEDGDNYTFTFKATTVGQATITFQDKDGEPLAQPASQTMAAVAGENKFTIAKSAFAEGVDAFWSITMDGAPIEGVVEVTDQTRGIYDFYNMMGVVVDNNTDSKDFGKIYIQQSYQRSYADAGSGYDGITTRANEQTSGIFVYNQDLDELNDPSNVGYKPTLPNGYEEIGSSYSTFQRLNIHPKTGDLVFSHAVLGKPAVFAINRDDMTGDVTNLLTGVADMTRSVAHCFDVDGTLFVMNFADNKGTIYKVINGEATKFTETSGRFINANITIASDGRGGFWISQNRGQIDYYYQLAHVTSEGAIDWSVYDDHGTYVAPQGNDPGKLGTSSLGWLGSSSRGALAYDAERNILAQGRNGKVELYTVSYEPTITLTPLHTIASNGLGNNIDGLAFDYAGDLYVVNSSKEKFQKFVLPTNDNTCTVPAPALEAIRFTPVYTVNVESNNNEWGIANGGGTFEEGQNATITAVAATNYKFVNWTKDGEIVSTETTYTFEVTESATYVANFEEITKYTINVTIMDDEKMGTVEGAGTYYEGTEVTLTAKANAGYVFVNWSDGNTDETRTFTAGVDMPETLTANFKVAVPRAWAYDLRLDADTDPDNYIFTFKTTSVGTATLNFKDKEGTISYTHSAVVATEKTTISIAKSTFDAANKDIYWEVELAGEAITKMAEITDPTRNIYDFYNMMGVVVDNDPNSEMFGKIYIQQSYNGAADGIADRSDTQTAGIFIYDQGLNELNNPANVGIKPQLPYTIGANRQVFKRITINPSNGDIAFCNNTTTDGGAYAVSRENLAGEAINLTKHISDIQKVNALCFDDEGNLYVVANVTGSGAIYKIEADGSYIKLTLNEENLFVDPEIAMAYDGRGGLWIAQNRWGTVAGTLFHVNVAEDKIDFKVEADKDYSDWFAGANYRGAIAYDKQRDILAVHSEKRVSVFHVTYAADGVPSISKICQTPNIGRNELDGLAFDYAGDLYVVNSGTERFYKYVLPTNDNTCTVPAPESQIIKKEARYTVTVAVNDNAMGTATGGGTEFLAGDIATLSATANDGYQFVNWTYGTTTSTDNPLELTVEGDITVTAHFEAKPLAIEGTVKRAVQIGESTVVLTHEANGTPHLYKVVDGTLVAEISQEGVIARDPDNAGDFLAISDIAATEDGKLVACNYILCQSPDGNGNDNVDANYKKGESRFYIWSNLTSNPTIWFTSKMSSNWFRSKQGYTMAVKGTSQNAEIFTTGTHGTDGRTRFSWYHIIDGVFEEPAVNTNDYYHFHKGPDNIHATENSLEAHVGAQYELNASPLEADRWIMDGNLVEPYEYVLPATNNVALTEGAALATDLGKKFNGATYLTVLGKHLMVAPYADGENVAGVIVLDITNGLDQAEEMGYAELTTPLAATAAATAVKVNGDDLTITLVVDNQVYMFNIDLNMQYTRDVTNGNFGTICLPYASASTNGAEFYEVAGKETDKVLLDQVTKLEAGRPYIFRATAGKLVVIYEGEEVSPGNYNGLYGTFIDNTPVTSGNYIVYQNELRLCGDGCYINANRAYLILDDVSAPQPVQAGRRRISMSLQGENQTTALDNITEEGTSPTEQATKIIHNGQLIIIRDGVMYNAQGQKL